MINSLPLFHRITGTRVLLLGDGEAAEPKRRLIERAGGIVENDIDRAIDAGVRIAFVAFDDLSTCEDAAEKLKAAGMLVNVVDQPDLCDFTTPSILDRGPVLIAVGTGGASAGLAKHLRLRLERILPQSLGALANALFNAKDKLRAKFPGAADRRRVIDEALREGGALDPMQARSVAKVHDWLEENLKSSTNFDETITLSSSDPEGLTLRQARLLGEADLIVIYGQIPDAIMARVRADAQLLNATDPNFSEPENGESAPQTIVRLVAEDYAA